LIDTGSGFKLRDDLSKDSFELLYGSLKTDMFDELYKQVGNNIAELEEFGRTLNETRE
jgi:hypothetical protein